MTNPHTFQVHRGWHILMTDLGINPANVLRRAELPGDLLARPKAALDTDEYFRLWTAVEEEFGDPALPIRIGEALSAEAFDPPLFAAMCSPNLNVALQRIAMYKRLVCPMVLHVDVGSKATTMEIEWIDASVHPPASLVGFELVFFVWLARMATRTHVQPMKAVAPRVLEPKTEFADFLGLSVQKGKRSLIAFRAADAQLPFLTANEEMWKTFEPSLKKRLSEIDESASTTERVHSALLEILPGGPASMETVAQRLGTSTRTLQRRLSSEKRNFQGVLKDTREALARHYLTTTQLTGSEISFLLGFEDPNSFFRAFHTWTGKTPEQVRGSMRRVS